MLYFLATIITVGITLNIIYMGIRIMVAEAIREAETYAADGVLELLNRQFDVVGATDSSVIPNREYKLAQLSTITKKVIEIRAAVCLIRKMPVLQAMLYLPEIVVTPSMKRRQRDALVIIE